MRGKDQQGGVEISSFLPSQQLHFALFHDS